MLASFVIVFREVLEAGLITGIVMAAIVGIRGRVRYLTAGVLAGVAGACLVAGFIDIPSTALAGNGQDVFAAAILVLAVLMLGWHTVWMARHGREIARQMKALGGAVQSGERSLFATAVVVAVAVLREGSAIALFLYGIAISAKLGAVALIGGGLAGLAAGGAVAWLLSTGSLLGKALQALVGYSDRPMGVQLLAYGATLAILIGASRHVARAGA